ncbi:MAG: hypothetical protein OXI30_12360 [Chloroflexota bacterium]|nr:hypothetical protein [Chloroflexota bacterium]
MESFEHMGYWWLPLESNEPISKVPETAIPGKLSFDPTTGGLLELRIEGRDLYMGFDNSVYSIIFGVAEAREYTLLNCTLVDGYRIQTRDFSTRQKVFAIETIIEGSHIESIDDITLEYVSASYTYLDDWMDQGNFQFEDGAVRYLGIEPTTIQLEDKEISFSAGIGEGISRTEVVMKESYWVMVTPNEAQPLQEYRQLIDIQLPNFLSLATGVPNYPSDIRAEITTGDMPKHINIYYWVSGYADKPRPMLPEHMMFTFKDVQNSPSKYLSNWISKSVELQSVYDLYHQSIYSRVIHFRTRFLLLAQALEAYHRNLYDEKYQKKCRYKSAKRALKDAIPEWIDDEHRSNLLASIDHGNDFSLKTRIVKILDKILRNYLEGDNFAIVDSLIGDFHEFAEEVKATRNYLTHHPKKRSKKVLSDDEIVEYIPKMLLLLRICLLIELGCPPEKIKHQVIGNPEFNRVTGRW